MTTILTFLTTLGFAKVKAILFKSLIASAGTTLLAGLSNPKVIYYCVKSTFQYGSVPELLVILPCATLQFSLSFFMGFYVNLYNRMNWFFSFFGYKKTPINVSDFETLDFDGIPNQIFLKQLLVAHNAVKLELESKLKQVETKTLELESDSLTLAFEKQKLEEKSLCLESKEMILENKLHLCNVEESTLAAKKEILEKTQKELEDARSEFLLAKSNYIDGLGSLDSQLESFQSDLVEKTSQIQYLKTHLGGSVSVIRDFTTLFEGEGSDQRVKMDSSKFSATVDSLKNLAEVLDSPMLQTAADFLSNLKPPVKIHVITDLPLEDSLEDDNLLADGSQNQSLRQLYGVDTTRTDT